MFNAYVSQIEWPACVEVRHEDENDVPPTNRLPASQRADVFRAGNDSEVESELHQAYTKGFVRCRRIA